jgi:hypothetical protein
MNSEARERGDGEMEEEGGWYGSVWGRCGSCPD